jgi:UDP-N-acetylmuramoyl-tripeptide--D-alanyl-D-alanine ligase
MAPAAARARFDFAELLPATRGRIIARPAGPEGVTAVTSDSRTVREGSLFVALAGERTDGHRYLSQAAAAGAVVLLVSEAQAEARREELEGIAARHGTGIIAVADPLAGLQDLARAHMRGLPSVRRIAVTGSNGKTTTKEIIGAILGRSAPTAMNEGNLNSEVGLPLACCAVTADHRYAVLEMGMNHPGEMNVLVDIVRPDFALITNIGTAHIGLLGSQEAIAAEKKKVFSLFDGRQTGFLPEGERYRAFLSEGIQGRIVFFGPKSTPGYGGSESAGLGGTIIHWEGSPVRFPLFGPHNLANALGAISVARELGVPNAEIRDGLEGVAPLFGRSQVIAGLVTVIADCYNANPDSMAPALDFIETLPWPGRRLAVLGSMRELGDETAAAHSSLGRRLRSSVLDAILLLGPEMEQAWKACQGSAARCAWFPEIGALGDHLASFVREGDIVLLKGSRSLAMEGLLPRLAAAGGPAHC